MNKFYTDVLNDAIASIVQMARLGAAPGWRRLPRQNIASEAFDPPITQTTAPDQDAKDND